MLLPKNECFAGCACCGTLGSTQESDMLVPSPSRRTVNPNFLIVCAGFLA